MMAMIHVKCPCGCGGFIAKNYYGRGDFFCHKCGTYFTVDTLAGDVRVTITKPMPLAVTMVVGQCDVVVGA